MDLRNHDTNRVPDIRRETVHNSGPGISQQGELSPPPDAIRHSDTRQPTALSLTSLFDCRLAAWSSVSISAVVDEVQ